MYRNIDQDIKLLNFAKRYYNEDISLNQIKYIAKLENYSEKEIESAINDYYWTRIYPDILIYNYLIPIVCFLIVVFIYFVKN